MCHGLLAKVLALNDWTNVTHTTNTTVDYSAWFLHAHIEEAVPLSRGLTVNADGEDCVRELQQHRAALGVFLVI